MYCYNMLHILFNNMLHDIRYATNANSMTQVVLAKQVHLDKRWELHSTVTVALVI